MSFEAIDYQDGKTALRGQLARPQSPARAAVLVFPTIANPTPAVESKARALVDAGYVAFIADFYGDTPSGPEQAFAWADALREDPEVFRQRLRASLEAINQIAPDLPVLAIGFCMGGQAVLELARDGADIAAVVSFHGLLETGSVAEPGAVKSRILVCHGDADPLVPREQVIAFWEEMDRARANWHFHSYSDVKHGFTNPNPPAGNDVVSYDASADRQSWAAMHQFFDEALGINEKARA